MSPPEPHRFDLDNLIAPALDGVLRAVSDRGNQTEARRAARSDDAETLIMSFQPRDAIDLMLTGQLVMFHELLADGARDVLRGMIDTMKQRSLSTLVAMGRVTQGHIDRLEKRGLQPHRTDAAAPQAEPRADQAANAATAEPAKRPVEATSPPAARQPSVPATRQPSAPAGQHPSAPPPSAPLLATSPPSAPPPSAPSAKVPPPAAVARPAAAAQQSPAPRPAAEETSWLDVPHLEWRVEFEADLARRAGSPIVPAGPTPARPVAPGDGTTPARTAATAETALPHRPAGYPPSRALADAGD